MSLTDFWRHLADVQDRFDRAKANREADPDEWVAAKTAMRECRQFWRQLAQGADTAQEG